MGTTSSLKQLLRGLCHNTQWNYAVFWKLKRRSRMLLIWEDGYCDNPKPGVTVESTPQGRSFSDKSGIISFGCEMDAHSGSSDGCLIELAVANMSCHLYSLGEGIVGKVAFTGKHRWIFASKFNSIIHQEYPEEWQIQFAAGIKTILLVPVVPHGVVQLGSLERVMEDSTVVACIKDLFNSLQLVAETRIPFISNEDPLCRSSPLTTSLTGRFSVSSAVTGKLLTGPEPQSMKKDLTDLNTEKVTKSRQLTVNSHLSPLFMVQDNLLASENDMQLVHEMDMGLCTFENVWKAKCGAISVVPTQDSCAPNQSFCPDHSEIVGDDMSCFACVDELHTFSQCDSINERLFAEQSTMLNSNNRDMQYGDYDSCYIEDTKGQLFAKEASEETSHKRNSSFLDFPMDSELHKALGPSFLPAHNDCTWDIAISGEDGLNSSTVACQTAETEAYKPLVVESDEWFMKASDTEHLLDAVIANLHHASDENASSVPRLVRSPCKSSRKFVGSCLTQSKAESDVLGADDSGSLGGNIKSVFFSRSQVFAGSPIGTSSKSTSILTDEESQNKVPGNEYYKRSAKSSHVGKRTKGGDVHKQRPRDRQLIQDRVKELRELVPNGAKCSIDALLDQTIKHMLFLRSISSQADKLRKCAYPKGCSEGWGSAKKEASWAYELGSQPEICPIIVENLDQPGHMLVEMLCKEYGLFLEIAEVIRHLELTILKGVMESRSGQLWAHFIVEATRGFHRMDILWPLMQLLQRNCGSPIPSKF